MSLLETAFVRCSAPISRNPRSAFSNGQAQVSPKSWKPSTASRLMPPESRWATLNGTGCCASPFSALWKSSRSNPPRSRRTADDRAGCSMEADSRHRQHPAPRIPSDCRRRYMGGRHRTHYPAWGCCCSISATSHRRERPDVSPNTTATRFQQSAKKRPAPRSPYGADGRSAN